jgi:tRNA1Val (adenine37-N6)-methyltransferase
MHASTVSEHEYDDLTDDALTGAFRIWQRRRGHRYSLDDVATAWVAVRARPQARCMVDLGCGVGSVLLMLAYKMSAAHAWGIEAQHASFELAIRNCARNDVLARVRVIHGDLRDASNLERLRLEAQAQGHDGLELVTGTPPYQPAGQGSVSPDSQRAHARVELRGGVEAYLMAAGQLVSPGGRVVICADARRKERVLEGAAQAGLAPLRSLELVPAANKPALFTVWTLSRASDLTSPSRIATERLVVRDAAGRRTPEANALRHFFDLDVHQGEAPSPPLRVRSQRVQVA